MICVNNKKDFELDPTAHYILFSILCVNNKPTLYIYLRVCRGRDRVVVVNTNIGYCNERYKCPPNEQYKY
jgi:hypothetical protein